MGQALIDIVSANHDQTQWDNVSYKRENQNKLFAPECSVLSLHSGWAHMHFHYLVRSNYIIFINVYNILNKNETRSQSAEDTSEFRYLIKNNILSHQAGFKEEELKEGHFNVTYLPFIDSKIKFEADTIYITLDIHPTSDYLLHLTREYPTIMTPLTAHIEAKKPYLLFPADQPCTEFMSCFINRILKAIERGGINYPILDKDVESLMINSLTYNPNLEIQVLNAERRRLHNEIYNKVTEDLTNFYDLNMLAKVIGSNKTTLNIQFKEAFHTTIMHLWKQYKLDEAMFMLVHHREKKIKDISYMLGYSTVGHLTSAFTKEHGIPPSMLRNNTNMLNRFTQLNF